MDTFDQRLDKLLSESEWRPVPPPKPRKRFDPTEKVGSPPPEPPAPQVDPEERKDKEFLDSSSGRVAINILRRIAQSMQEYHNTPRLGDDLDCTLFNMGCRPIGKVGEKVIFDSKLHKPITPGLWPGDEAVIYRPGLSLNRRMHDFIELETDMKVPYVLIQAIVRGPDHEVTQDDIDRFEGRGQPKA